MNRSTYFGMLFAMLSVGLAAMCLILGEQGRVEGSYARGWAAGSNSMASRPVPTPLVITQQFVVVVTNVVGAAQMLNDLPKWIPDEEHGDLIIPEPKSPFDLPLPK